MEAVQSDITHLDFLCVNDGKPIDIVNAQGMQCIVCYNESTPPVILKLRTKCRKDLITYFSANGITTLRKHVGVEHCTFSQKYCEDVSSTARTPSNRQIEEEA